METSLLAGWDNFYVIVGSSAGALTGLTFVVIALVREAQVYPAGVSVFVTPTIVHFSGVLGLAAFMTMPHQHVPILGVGFAAGGLAGLAYSAFIAAHMPRQSSVYVAVREDWIWNVIVPGLAYGCLFIVGALLPYWPQQSLYVVAGLSLLMLFVGIHNAWDIAVWMTVNRRENKREDKREDK
jgi:hypothetical protein